MFPDYGTDPKFDARDPGPDPVKPEWTCPNCGEDCACVYCGALCTQDCESHDCDAAYVPEEEMQS